MGTLTEHTPKTPLFKHILTSPWLPKQLGKFLKLNKLTAQSIISSSVFVNVCRCLHDIVLASFMQVRVCSVSQSSSLITMQSNLCFLSLWQMCVCVCLCVYLSQCKQYLKTMAKYPNLFTVRTSVPRYAYICYSERYLRVCLL